MDLFWNILFYICLGFAFYHFIYKKFQKEGILTAIGIMLTVYTLCYNSMNDDYNARKIVINSWAEKAVDHLREFKDGDLAYYVTRMQLTNKPSYLNIFGVLTYKANESELSGELEYDFVLGRKKCIQKVMVKLFYIMNIFIRRQVG